MSGSHAASQSVLRASFAVNDFPLSSNIQVRSQPSDPLMNAHEEICAYTRAVQSRPSVESSPCMQHKIRAAEFRLGYALLQFGGPEPVIALIDPKVRANPRARQAVHCQKLLEAFKAEKMDRNNPIVLVVRRNLIPADDLMHMALVDPFKSSPPPRLFRLLSKSEEEADLDAKIWTGFDLDGRLLNQETLDASRQRRQFLIESRDRAYLANGSHRWGAMDQLSQEISDQHTQYRSDFLTNSDLNSFVDSMKQLAEDLPRFTFWAEIYDENIPQELLAVVAENPEIVRLPAGVGETVYIHCERWNGVFRQVTSKNPEMSHEDHMNLTHQILSPTSYRKKQESQAPTAIVELLASNSVVLEMLLDCSFALPVFDELGKANQAKGLLSSSGGILTAYVWLSISTLSQVCSVDPDSLALVDCENFTSGFASHTIPDGGHPDSSALWEALHSPPLAYPVPSLLALYDHTATQEFSKAYVGLFKDYIPSQGRRSTVTQSVNWSLPETQKSVRVVFFRFAEYILTRSGNQPDCASRAFATALKLYCLLPEGSGFEPRAALPCRELFLHFRASSSFFEGPGCILIDLAFDRHSIIWSQGNSTGNWYSSIPGSHKVLRMCVNNETLGPLSVRLVKAITLMESPQVKSSLDIAKSHCSSWVSNVHGNAFHRLRSACGTFHKPSSYTILQEDGVSVEYTLLKAARRALYDYAHREDGEIGAVLSSHQVLSIVSPDFWRLFQFRRWILGHHARSRKTNMRNVRVAVGWGLLIDRFVSGFIRPALQAHPSLRFLLELSTGSPFLQVWWTDVLCQSPTSGPSRLPQFPPSHSVRQTQVQAAAGPSRLRRDRSTVRSPSPADWRIVKKSARSKKGKDVKHSARRKQPKSRSLVDAAISSPIASPERAPAEVEPNIFELPTSVYAPPNPSRSAESERLFWPASSSRGSPAALSLSNALEAASLDRSGGMPFTMTGRLAADVEFNTPCIQSRDTAFTLQNFIALDVFAPHFEGFAHDEQAIVDTLTEFQHTTPDLIRAIFRVRRSFRETAVSMASTLSTAPLGASLVATGLGAVAILLKQSYVVSLAQAIAVHTGCEPQSAMNEALRIARADRLWTQQIFPIHGLEESHVVMHVDLQCSRPAIRQTIGNDPSLVCGISDSLEDFLQLQHLSSMFSSVLGCGPTEYSSYNGAIGSVELLQAQINSPEPDCRYTSDGVDRPPIRSGLGAIRVPPEPQETMFDSLTGTGPSPLASSSHVPGTETEDATPLASRAPPSTFDIAAWPKDSRVYSQASLLRGEDPEHAVQQVLCNSASVNEGDLYFGDGASCFSSSNFAFSKTLPRYQPELKSFPDIDASLEVTLRIVDEAWRVAQEADDHSFHEHAQTISSQRSLPMAVAHVLVSDSDTE